MHEEMMQCKWGLTMVVFVAQIQLLQSMHLVEDMQKPVNGNPTQGKKLGQQLAKGKLVKKKGTQNHSALPWTWYAADAPDDSCDKKCSSMKQACSEVALRHTTNRARCRNAANEAGMDCDESIKYFPTSFPAMVIVGTSVQCFYTLPDYEDSCKENSGHMVRLCPCEPLRAFGDPHLSNMNGDFFDVNREGISTFLDLNPQGKNQTDIRIDALIDHPGDGSKCFGYYIRRMWIKGSIVGEDIEVSTEGSDLRGNDTLKIQIGDKVMQNARDVTNFVYSNPGKYDMMLNDERIRMRPTHVNNRIKFATLRFNVKGAEFVIDWSTGDRKPNILEFRANKLGLLGSKWSGLLARDDHTWASSLDATCKKRTDYTNTAQLLQEEEPVKWRSSASLD